MKEFAIWKVSFGVWMDSGTFNANPNLIAHTVAASAREAAERVRRAKQIDSPEKTVEIRSVERGETITGAFGLHPYEWNVSEERS